MLRRARPIELELPFAAARANFYAAARHGLDAAQQWPGAKPGATARDLLMHELLPAARSGLAWLGIPAAEIDHYLAVIQGRLAKDQTGARWQRRWVAHHGRDMARMTLAYLERQQTGKPVHEWSV